MTFKLTASNRVQCQGCECRTFHLERVSGFEGNLGWLLTCNTCGDEQTLYSLERNPWGDGDRATR